MKYLIAADLHGSAYFCRALLAAFERERASRLLLLGDILYHGPRNDLPREYLPGEVISMLNQQKNRILAVRGNCDTEVDQMVLEFPILADYCLVAAGERMLFATHGHRFHRDSLPPLIPGDILLYGHTHVPAWERLGEIWCLNPGSLSIPKEGSRHSYMTFDGETFLWKDLETGAEYHREAL